MLLTQNQTLRKTEFISSAELLNQTVYISDTDMIYLLAKATYITTYWFIDCRYVGPSNNFTLINHYKKENSKYDIEGLVVASFEPLPEPTTTTTPAPTTSTTTPTPTTSTTTTTTTTTTKPSTTTQNSTFTTTTAKPIATETTQTTKIASTIAILNVQPTKNVFKRDVDAVTYTNKVSQINATTTNNQSNQFPSLDEIEINVGNQLVINRTNVLETMTKKFDSTELISDQPFVCFNKSSVAPDPKKVYGYFRRQIIVKSKKTAISNHIFEI